MKGRLSMLGLVLALAGWGGSILMKLWDMQEWPGYVMAALAVIAGSWLAVAEAGAQ